MAHLAAALAPTLSKRLPRPSNAAWRWLALAVVAGLTLTSGDTARVIAEALSEAYLAVTVFVAGTLALLYGLEAAFKADIGLVLARHRRWQVPAAALLGAFPGCGGAIVAVTQYTRGYLTFGGLVATLTATMGDAMFLLLAKEPATGAMILLLGIAVGTLSGYLIDAPCMAATFCAQQLRRRPRPRRKHPARSTRLPAAFAWPGCCLLCRDSRSAFWLLFRWRPTACSAPSPPLNRASGSGSSAPSWRLPCGPSRAKRQQAIARRPARSGRGAR